MKGRKTGGRQMGTRNKATVQKERIAQEIAERTIADARSSGKKLAKEVLEDCMNVLGGMAAHYQPAPPDAPVKPHANEEKFIKYIEMTIYAAKSLASYQSPTFKAVAVSVTPGSGDGPRPQPGDDAKIVDITDVKRLSRIYQDMIRTGNK